MTYNSPLQTVRVVDFETVEGERKRTVTKGSEQAQKVFEALRLKKKPPPGAPSEAGETAKRPDVVTIRLSRETIDRAHDSGGPPDGVGRHGVPRRALSPGPRSRLGTFPLGLDEIRRAGVGCPVEIVLAWLSDHPCRVLGARQQPS